MYGDNKPAQQEQWIIPHADRQAGTGVEMPVEVESWIAPLINDAGESYVTNVEYTVDIYIPIHDKRIVTCRMKAS